ncbi:MAG: hypothetical protein ACI4A5_06265 [Hominilimicola sp.]
MAYGYNGYGNYGYPFSQNNDPWRQSMYAQNYNNALNQQFNSGIGNNNASLPSPQSNADFIMVSSADEAWATQVQPGQIRWMMRNDGQYIYVKAVNDAGQISKRIVRTIDEQETSSVTDYSPNEKAAVETLTARLAEVENRLNALEKSGKPTNNTKKSEKNCEATESN